VAREERDIYNFEDDGSEEEEEEMEMEESEENEEFEDHIIYHSFYGY